MLSFTLTPGLFLSEISCFVPLVPFAISRLIMSLMLFSLCSETVFVSTSFFESSIFLRGPSIIEPKSSSSSSSVFDCFSLAVSSLEKLLRFEPVFGSFVVMVSVLVFVAGASMEFEASLELRASVELGASIELLASFGASIEFGASILFGASIFDELETVALAVEASPPVVIGLGTLFMISLVKPGPMSRMVNSSDSAGWNGDWLPIERGLIIDFEPFHERVTECMLAVQEN